MFELWQDESGANGQGVHPNHDHPKTARVEGAKSPEVMEIFWDFWASSGCDHWMATLAAVQKFEAKLLNLLLSGTSIQVKLTTLELNSLQVNLLTWFKKINLALLKFLPKEKGWEGTYIQYWL